MTFLSPTPALIAAAVSNPLLLLIYFLRLRRKPLRVSSTLLWEQAAKDLQVNVPFRWLRVSTVLLLQLAALASLLLAMARPAIRGDAPLADRVVIVIDHSASMSAKDGVAPGVAAADGGGAVGVTATPTRLDEAKARALDLVRQLSRGRTSSGQPPAAMVVASAATARVVQPLTSLTSDLIDAIRNIEPTDQPGDIVAAAELLDAARSATPEDVRRSQQIVAFTDLPADARPDTAGLPMRIIRITGRGSGTGTSPPPPAGATTSPATPGDNLGIIAFSVRRDLESPDTIRVFARVTGTSTQPVTATVRCLFDDQPVAWAGGVRTVTVPAAGGGASVQEAGVSFEFPQRSGGVVVAMIDRPDLLDADNAAAAVIGPVTSPAVLVVGPGGQKGEDGTAGPDADPFLLGFLESLHPRSLRVVDAPSYESEAADARTEQRRAWRDFNLVVFDRTMPSPGAVPAQPSISFGAGLPLPGLGLREHNVPPALPPLPARTGAIRFDTWRRAHPVMRYVALEPIIISPPPPTIDTSPPASSNAPSHILPLASGPDGPLIAALEEPGVGTRRIIVSFPLARSNWAPDTSFAVFMANAVDQLTGRGEAAIGQAYSTTQPVTVRTAPGVTSIALTGPRTLRIDAPGPAEPGVARTVGLGTLDLAGVYRPTGAVESAVAVNLVDQTETLLGRSSEPAAARHDGSAPPPPSHSAQIPDASEEGRREIWHWFVLLGAAIASLEWLVFAWRFRA